jgi:hypothetical protein
VAGLTKMNDLSQASQILDGNTRSPRSLGLSRGCLTDSRRTWIWCRSAGFPGTSPRRDLMIDAAVLRSSVIIHMRLKDQGRNVKWPRADGIFTREREARQ